MKAIVQLILEFIKDVIIAVGQVFAGLAVILGLLCLVIWYVWKRKNP